MLPESPSLADNFSPVSYDEWRAVVEQELQGALFDKKLVSRTYDGIAIQPLYSAREFDHAGDPCGMPGSPPFVRGGAALGAALAGWDIRQAHSHPDIAACSEAILADLNSGVTSVQLRLDAAARNGHDAQDDGAADAAGRDGAMIYARADLDRLLRDVRLDIIGVALEAGGAFLPAAGILTSLWRERDIAPEAACGTFNADPLGALAADGALPVSLDASLRRMADLARYTSENWPQATAVGVNTAPYHHAGATAAQDLAISLATGVEYLRAMTNAGMSVAAAAEQVLFQYRVGCQFFLAISKLRAARLLWARVIEAAGGDANAQRMHIHARPSERILTKRDPWVNLLRNTACCFSAATGGADAITVEPFDAVLGVSGAFSRRIARNTQLILQEESHLHRVVDPAGGSWFVERFTNDLAAKAWTIFQEIERRGGMAAALTSGWVAEQISTAFEPRARNLATRKDAITGVSEFPNLGEKPVEVETPDLAALREAAIERLRERKRESDLDAKLDAVVRIAQADGAGLAEACDAAAGAGATIGQLAAALRIATEQPASIAAMTASPYAAAFEELRDASDAYLAKHGARPRVFLANLGPVAQHTARAAYARNFFEAGGFEVATNDGFADGELAAAAFKTSAAKIAVICSSDKLYETMVADIVPKLKAAGARTVILAGHPGEHEPDYRAAGVDRFIYIRCDVLGTLRELLAEEGVLA